VTFEWVESQRKRLLLRFVDLLFLKEKQIHHVIKFSFLFGLTDSLSRLDKDSIKIKRKTD